MSQIDPATRAEIAAAFRAGTLRVKTADPETLEVSLKPVRRVLRHNTPHKPLVRLETWDGRAATTTEDHSLFTVSGGALKEVQPRHCRPGSLVVVVDGNQVRLCPVKSVTELPPEPHTYDLEVPGPQNFTLTCGLLAHNSYSIGGVSLDIEKSAKYESAKQNAEGQFDKAVQGKLETTKYIRGLKQPRFGIGVRSAFGPALGRGVLSPRSFVA